MLDQQLKRLDKDFLKDGDLRERITRARLQARDQQRNRQGKVTPAPPQPSERGCCFRDGHACAGHPRTPSACGK
ncbi:MAG: hypothetical protein HYS23_10155 [Geobacter sp.]|nr:hypothetical protein [Geobacter sp.]